MTLRLGIIAEDKSDVDVVETLLRKISQKNFSVNYFAAKGSGKLRANARNWARNLFSQGCNRLLVVHDLDHYSEKELKESLHASILECKIAVKSVIIPVREV